jgi:hypothetical protein
MALKLVALVTLGMAAMLAGQPELLAQSGVAPLPPIGLPLPQIGLPLPRIGLPPPAPRGGAVVNRPAPTRRGPRSRRANRPPGYLVPAYSWPFLVGATTTFIDAATMTATTDYPGGATVAPALPVTGWVALDVDGGGDQQVYLDGYYVGTPLELGGQLELEAGPHVIEIRATGYHPLRIPINVAPGRSISYRGTLTMAAAAPGPETFVPAPAPLTPSAPMTGYIIPGCYVGNVPPTEVALPAGCDVSRVIRFN